jgi:hypothetical protein
MPVFAPQVVRSLHAQIISYSVMVFGFSCMILVRCACRCAALPDSLTLQHTTAGTVVAVDVAAALLDSKLTVCWQCRLQGTRQNAAWPQMQHDMTTQCCLCVGAVAVHNATDAAASSAGCRCDGPLAARHAGEQMLLLPLQAFLQIALADRMHLASTDHFMRVRRCLVSSIS